MKRSVFMKTVATALAVALILAGGISVTAEGTPKATAPQSTATAADVGEEYTSFSEDEVYNVNDAIIEETELPDSLIVSETASDINTQAETVPLPEATTDTVVSETDITTHPVTEDADTEADVPDTEENETEEASAPSSSYDVSALTFAGIPTYLLSSIGANEAPAEKAPVGLAADDAEQLNSFTTINADGSNTLYLFGTPIKYIDQSTNKIKFIDNSIVPVLSQTEIVPPAKEEADLQQIAEPATVIGYTNAANDFSVNMPASVNDGISLIKDELSVTLYPALPAISSAALSTETIGAMTEQVVEYRNALGNGVHLQYVPINGGIKENIVLDSYTGVNTFNFIVEAQGYYPLYTEGEAIPFAKTGTEEVAFILGQVDARDSYTGEETDGHFTLYNSLSLIEIKDGIYGLTVTVDPEFLADPDTVYPVVIDPSVTISSSYMQDTSVYSGIPNGQNYYSSAYNIVGNHGNSYGVGTAFIKALNLDNYNILPGNITSATYKVYEGSGKTNSVLVRVGRPRFEWDQDSVTYNEKPRTDPVSFLTVSSSGWKNFDITDIVWEWMTYVDMGTGKGVSPEHGFSLEAVNASDSSLHFCSVNHSNYAPSIIINYDNVGKTIDLEAVYTKNGDAAFKAFGYLIHGTSPQFKIKITTAGTYYIQTLNCEPQFGYGFSSTANIKLLNSSGQTVSLSNVSGSSAAFDYKSVYLTAGTYYLLVYNGSGTRTNVRCYVIMERSGQLSYSYTEYSNLTKDFYKVGDASSDYKCLGYVVRDRTSGINLPSNETTAISLLTSDNSGYGCDVLSQPENPCFVLYGMDTRALHIVIIEWNLVKSKLGQMELVRHSKINAFFSHYDSYGFPISYYTDPFAT